MQVIGDIGNTFQELNKFIPKDVRKWDIQAQKEARKNIQDSFKLRTTGETEPWLYQERIVADIQKCSDEIRSDDRHLTLVLDSGGSQLWMLRNWNCLDSSELLSSNCFASMGIGMPAAIGVAHHYKKEKQRHRVLALLGDGGFIMNLQEMETATRLNLDLVVVVWINEALGLVQWGDRACFDIPNPT
jgi:acetolactate synthase-1/2/3 large subunit